MKVTDLEPGANFHFNHDDWIMLDMDHPSSSPLLPSSEKAGCKWAARLKDGVVRAFEMDGIEQAAAIITNPYK